MRYAIPLITAAALAALAGCDRPTSTSSTTVVKEPVAQKEPAVQKEKETVVQKEPVIQKEKETVVERQPSSSSTTVVQAPSQPQPPSSSTTVVQPPAQSSTNVTIDARKQEEAKKADTTRSTSTTRLDTPFGTTSRTETQTSNTTR